MKRLILKNRFLFVNTYVAVGTWLQPCVKCDWSVLTVIVMFCVPAAHVASGQVPSSSLVKTVKGRWADLNTKGC